MALRYQWVTLKTFRVCFCGKIILQLCNKFQNWHDDMFTSAVFYFFSGFKCYPCDFPLARAKTYHICTHCFLWRSFFNKDQQMKNTVKDSVEKIKSWAHPSKGCMAPSSETWYIPSSDCSSLPWMSDNSACQMWPCPCGWSAEGIKENVCLWWKTQWSKTQNEITRLLTMCQCQIHHA